MGLSGKLSAKLEIRSKGDLFHELARHKPHLVPSICPDKVRACDLHEGDWGAHGSVINWKYVLDGKEQTVKNLVGIDEEKKCVTLKVLEGDLLKLYKSFSAHVSVDTSGDVHFVIWEIEYEKINDDTAEPISILKLFIDVSRDAEAHHLKN